MAISDKTGLWKLAAAKLGMAPSVHVLNAASPTTALELTFAQFYDQIRISKFLEGRYDFLRRREVLWPAPYIDCNGDAHVWTESWNYVYSPPVNMLAFLHFATDLPSAGVTSDYEELQLPISYLERSLTVVSGYTIGANISNYLPAFRWIGGFHAFMIDDARKVWWMEDFNSGGAQGEPVMVIRESTTKQWIGWSGISNEYYNSGYWEMSLVDGNAVWNLYGGTANPVYARIAYGNPREEDETVITTRAHIATNLAEAEAVYLIDDTNPGNWPVPVQDAIAAQLAYEASLTHAKSPRVIAALEKEAFRSFSKSISLEASDDGQVEGGGPSRAKRARA